MTVKELINSMHALPGTHPAFVVKPLGAGTYLNSSSQCLENNPDVGEMAVRSWSVLAHKKGRFTVAVIVNRDRAYEEKVRAKREKLFLEGGGGGVPDRQS